MNIQTQFTNAHSSCTARIVLVTSVILVLITGCVKPPPPPTPPPPTPQTHLEVANAHLDAWKHPTFSSNGDGILKQDLYVQFAAASVSGASDPKTGKPVNKIWTRAYGTAEGRNLIPGPFYVFHPGDLLDVTMRNLLSEKNHPLLRVFDNDVDPSYDTDEIIMQIKSEINVPHNPNNTNLHTHGLHVDPSRDDVDVVMAPEGDSSHYAHDISDQPVKRGSWRYAYRIPIDHLPGTHWFHAHKHGSTSIHVENGMAGTLTIKPKSSERAIVPSLWTESGFGPHDRPMVLQEIANYAGGAQGPGESLEDKDTGGAAAAGNKQKAASASPDITINGVHQPTLVLQPGRLERWRIVNAGANHRTFSYLWLGKVLARDNKNNPTKVQEIPFYLVAIDGITLNKKEAMSAKRPVFLAPGNRADLLVQINEIGDYGFFKNFPKTTKVFDQNGIAITPITDGGITNPYGFPETNAGTTNFNNQLVKWLDVTGNLASGKNMPVTPILGVQKTTVEGQTVLEVAHDKIFPTGKWQPVIHAGGGAFDTQLLVNITVEGAPVSDVFPPDSHLSQLSPTGSGSMLIKNQQGDVGIPAYASPIMTSDIVQSRTAVFDLSGFSVNVFNTAQPKKTTQVIKQFSLNGRQFTVKDFIGNYDAAELIQELPTLPPLPAGSKTGVMLNPIESKSKTFKNTYWINPGYYSNVTGSNAAGFRYATTTKAPTYQDLTGIPTVSQVNTARAPLPANIPGPPVATTAEEWILINNSDIGHPFHIHISPFFVTEVGQVGYTNGKWALDKINSDNKAKHAMGWVVDNWWDTILIPPHGYIKFRAWMNVPQQTPFAEKDMNAINVAGQTFLNKALENPSSITVADNVNREAAWVYHCHILRHEDRGMMMTVKTQPNSLLP